MRLNKTMSFCAVFPKASTSNRRSAGDGTHAAESIQMPIQEKKKKLSKFNKTSESGLVLLVVSD